MDCEKFDRVVLDLLYEELDELTSAAAKRHMDHCARCRAIGSGLRATREVGVLPLIEPPEGLQSRILEAERKARARLPLGKRVGRAISVAADYAMRPQLAMAAVLLLMIGASLLFIRVEPGQRDSVHVTERGIPESEGESVAIVPLPEKRPAAEPELARSEPAAPSPIAAEARRARGKLEESETAAKSGEAEGQVANAAPLAGVTGGADSIDVDAGPVDPDYDQAMAAFTSGRYGEAQRGFDAVAAKNSTNAPSAALFAARANRADVGCEEAAPRFDKINTRYKGTNIGHEAAWQAADCYRALGKNTLARKHYEYLLEVAAYRDRAQQAIASLDQEMVASRAEATTKSPPKAKASKPAAAAPKKAAPPPAPVEQKSQDSAF